VRLRAQVPVQRRAHRVVGAHRDHRGARTGQGGHQEREAQPRGGEEARRLRREQGRRGEVRRGQSEACDPEDRLPPGGEMRRALLAVALVLVPAVAAAQFNLNLNKILDTGKNIVDATKDVNEKQEAEIGAEYAAVLLGASPLLANPEVERYVNRVGRWLSLNSERPDLNWQFGVLDTGTV